jgi:hypothetical protein
MNDIIILLSLISLLVVWNGMVAFSKQSSLAAYHKLRLLENMETLFESWQLLSKCNTILCVYDLRLLLCLNYTGC